MWRRLSALFVAASLCGADDPWKKVQEIPSGAEVRIFKKVSRTPILAKMDEVNQERIVVVVKNEQTAIPKEEIDRVDARPVQKGSRVVRESTVQTNQPDKEAGRPGASKGAPGPSQSVSSGVSIGGKPDFVTVYRRTATVK